MEKQPEFNLSNPALPEIIHCQGEEIYGALVGIRSNRGHTEGIKIGPSPADYTLKVRYENQTAQAFEEMRQLSL